MAKARALPIKREVLEQVAELRGLTYVAIIAKMDINAATFDRWLSGENVYMTNLAKLADILGVSVGVLTGKEPLQLPSPDIDSHNIGLLVQYILRLTPSQRVALLKRLARAGLPPLLILCALLLKCIPAIPLIASIALYATLSFGVICLIAMLFQKTAGASMVPDNISETSRQPNHQFSESSQDLRASSSNSTIDCESKELPDQTKNTQGNTTNENTSRPMSRHSNTAQPHPTNTTRGVSISFVFTDIHPEDELLDRITASLDEAPLLFKGSCRVAQSGVLASEHMFPQLSNGEHFLRICYDEIDVYHHLFNIIDNTPSKACAIEHDRFIVMIRRLTMSEMRFKYDLPFVIHVALPGDIKRRSKS